MPETGTIFGLGAFLSIVMSCAIMRLGRLRSDWSGLRHGKETVQAIHEQPTPRTGGIAVFISLAVMTLMYTPQFFWVGSYILLSAIPVFTVGLIEDIRGCVKPKLRLFAAFISGAVMIALTQAWLLRVDIPFIDTLLAIAPIGIAFTLLSCGGLAHAFNLIDGMNGLSGLTSITVALSLAVLAYLVGDTALVIFAAMIAVACLGFLMFNFPQGRIFLGDAGAYTLGHVLSWTGIMLVVRNPELSAWTVLLIFFWPVMETLFSIFRRVVNRVSADQADKMHLHHLVFRCVRRFQSTSRANPMSTVIMLPIIIIPAAAALFIWESVSLSMFYVFLMAVIYVALYQFFISLCLSRKIS